MPIDTQFIGDCVIRCPIQLVFSLCFWYGAKKLSEVDQRDRVWRLVIRTTQETLHVLGSVDKSVNAVPADAINEAVRRRSAS
jgi:hypothetical protein